MYGETRRAEASSERRYGWHLPAVVNVCSKLRRDSFLRNNPMKDEHSTGPVSCTSATRNMSIVQLWSLQRTMEHAQSSQNERQTTITVLSGKTMALHESAS